MSTGWIKLHRQLLEWEWYDDTNTKCLFLHCLLRANHSDTEWRGHKIKRGQFLTSVDTLTRETGLSVSQIRTSMKKLISTNEIASKSQARSTVITVLGYDSHQDNDKPHDKLMTMKSQADDNEIATDKNVIIKECKNDKKETVNNICQQVADEYNNILPELGKVKVLSDKRKSWIRASIKQMSKTEHDFSEIGTWTKYFNYVSNSDFLMGQKSDWSATFDFLVNKNNLLKVVEGTYE